MDLSKILSISGKSGLFKVVSQLKNAVLVESLVDKKRFPAFGHEKISSLEEIAVFTSTEDKPLKEILKAIFDKEDGKPAIDTRADNKAILAYFKEVVPDFDQERVYISDIRKIISWYNMLIENNLLDFSEKEEEKEGEKTTDGKDEQVQAKPKQVAKKPVKSGEGQMKAQRNIKPAAPRQSKKG
jgi:hypothetical protein